MAGKTQAKNAESPSGKASLSLTFPTLSSSKAAYDALLSESEFSHRGHSRVRMAGKTVVIEVVADDLVSLRASLNSYLRLMHIIKSVDEKTSE
ncbi:MAG: KEOPS complex subunit Pcc1 [Candidatus Micrarchaeota archaeon]|nr:KEOPS complex subunit Pcc1 [Candidatus Micrarchaeota archaeon]